MICFLEWLAVMNEMQPLEIKREKYSKKNVEVRKLDKVCVSGNCIQEIQELCFPFPIMSASVR